MTDYFNNDFTWSWLILVPLLFCYFVIFCALLHQIYIPILRSILGSVVRCRFLTGDIYHKPIEKPTVSEHQELFEKYVDALFVCLNSSLARGLLAKEEVDILPEQCSLLQQVEFHVGIRLCGVDDFRRSMAVHLGMLSQTGDELKWDCNVTLKKAIEYIIERRSAE